MAVRTDIQYVQYFVPDSSARKLAPKRSEKHAAAPKQRKLRRRVIVVDPVAIVGALVAVVMLVLLLTGIGQYRQSRQQNQQMQAYIQQLQQENQQLEAEYRAGYDLDHIRDVAEALGMIPEAEATHIQMEVTVPQEEPVKEMSWWDTFTTFLAGLFA